jgi:hypothetical protein
VAATDDVIGGWIRNAENSGEIKNLPGYGRPIVLEDDSHIPSEHRMMYKILKNAGVVPPEVELIKELAALKESLVDQPESIARDETLSQIREAQLKLDVALDKFKSAP